MNSTHFQLYKSAAVVSAFALSTLLQFLLPYRGTWREAVRNWKSNFLVALTGAILLGVICGGCVCTLASHFETRGWGLTNWLRVPSVARVMLSIVALDFVAYAWHRANHRFRPLWRFHAVHHSDEIFDASTAVRFHPGELVISLGIRLLTVATLGLPVVGLLAFEMIYALFNFFEHGNTRLPRRIESALACLFITPALHRKHHSKELTELNSNYGTIFSFWDRWLGTKRASSSTESVTVGLMHKPDPHRAGSLLAMPFRG